MEVSNSPMRTLLTLLALTLVAGVLIGCRGVPVTATSYTAGEILVVPVREVVQKGQPHEYGAGSGSIFEDNLATYFERSAFTLRTTDNPEFSATEICSKEMALAEGQSLGSDFVLQAVLGEFRNAAPASFRSDFVILESARMYDVRTGEVVWQFSKPYTVSKGNIGNHLGLLKSLAKVVANSITAHGK